MHRRSRAWGAWGSTVAEGVAASAPAYRDWISRHVRKLGNGTLQVQLSDGAAAQIGRLPSLRPLISLGEVIVNWEPIAQAHAQGRPTDDTLAMVGAGAGLSAAVMTAVIMRLFRHWVKTRREAGRVVSEVTSRRSVSWAPTDSPRRRRLMDAPTDPDEEREDMEEERMEERMEEDREGRAQAASIARASDLLNSVRGSRAPKIATQSDAREARLARTSDLLQSARLAARSAMSKQPRAQQTRCDELAAEPTRNPCIGRRMKPDGPTYNSLRKACDAGEETCSSPKRARKVQEPSVARASKLLDYVQASRAKRAAEEEPLFAGGSPHRRSRRLEIKRRSNEY